MAEIIMTGKKKSINSSTPPGAIQVLNKQRRHKIRGSSVGSFCGRVLRSLSKDPKALSVVFVNPPQMRSINATYLRHDYATDVLSFSYRKIRMEGLQFLGEIIIAPEVAAKQAERYKTSLEMELRKLLVHGILHLLGYNHETDAGEMNRLQKRLLRRRLLAEGISLVDTRGIS